MRALALSLTALRNLAARHKRIVGALVVLVASFTALRLYEASAGTSIFVRHAGTTWIPVSENTTWLARPVRMALHRPAPVAHPGAMAWQALDEGFEVAELPALVGGEEVDRIFLARIDPKRYRFIVRNDPQARTNLEQWMARTNALLVVNGSYFARSGAPATPVMMDGAAAGPASYSGSHGAFVSNADHSEIRDLAHEVWSDAFRGSDTAMVSYPLLIAPDGSSRAPRDTGWLANRSFIGEDSNGFIIIGTTQGAFFALDRLADFLKAAPLDLKLALNLDGGPVACQGIALGRFHRMSYGRWELQRDTNDQAYLLPAGAWRHEPMPIVLAVLPR